jgi:hypothetical protein
VAYFITNQPEKIAEGLSWHFRGKAMCFFFSPRRRKTPLDTTAKAKRRLSEAKERSAEQTPLGEIPGAHLPKGGRDHGDRTLCPSSTSRLEISTTFLPTVIKYLRKKLWNVQ